MITELIVFIFILLIIYLFFINNKKESFNNIDDNTINDKKYFKSVNNYNDIYDDFYVFYYDDIYYNNNYYISISQSIIKYINSVYNNHLCIGIKHGGHINEILKENIPTLSISKSNSIINKCNYNYNSNNYKYYDGYDINPYLFNENEFTHISLIDNEIYYYDDIIPLFNNCYKWLMHKGYFFIQCYDNINNFKNNISDNQIKNNFLMKYNYSKEFKTFNDNNSFYFIEKIKQNKKMRTNIHNLYFQDEKYILNVCNNIGFDLKEKIILNKYQNLFVFKKNR